MRANRSARVFRRDRAAVSPVIGTVLILVIMIFSIAGILAWGAPAIQGLQESAEFNGVLAQFLQMDSEVRNLRDPQNTRIVTLTVGGGILTFGKGDRWVVTGMRDAAFDPLYLGGWEGSNPASLNLLGIDLAGKQVSVDVASGGSFTNRFSCSSCANPISLGTAKLDTDSVRIQVKSGGTVKAETWIINAGSIKYKVDSGSDRNVLHFAMGAVFSQQQDSFFLEESPTIKDPDYTVSPKDTNLFLRLLQLNGTAAAQTGKGRFPIVFNLVDNYGASRGRPSFDPATAARLQIHGELEAPFCAYLDARPGWESSGACPASGTAGNVNLKFNRGSDGLVYDLNHALVTTIVRAL